MTILNATRISYPSQDTPVPALVAVLTQGAVQDLAVYIGYGTLEWVAANGDKLSCSAACRFFPGLADLPEGFTYRD